MNDENTVVYNLDPDKPNGLSDEAKARYDATTEEDIDRAIADDPGDWISTDKELEAFPSGIDPLELEAFENELNRLSKKFSPELLTAYGIKQKSQDPQPHK